MKEAINKIEALIEEATMKDMLINAVNSVKGRLIKNISSEPVAKKAPAKRKKDLELEYDILVSNKNIIRFMRKFDPTYFRMTKKEIVQEIKLALDALSSWIDTLNTHHNMNIDKEKFMDRFLPFYDVGNGDLGMLDRKTKKFVWFAHDSAKVVVDENGKRINF